MVNRWTGAHDAVLELSPAGVDRILAAVHRKGDPSSSATNGPHVLHRLALNLPLAGSPPGAPNLRGHLKLQVSTPSVDVPPGPLPASQGPSRVRVTVQIFAWFQALPGSDPAPAFLHGTLAITVGVRVFRCHGQLLGEIEFAGEDLQVEFTPAAGSGATAADVALVLAAAPALLRSGVGSAQIPIGALSAGTFAVRQLDFKTLRAGGRDALALLLVLRSSGAAAPSPSQVTEVFLGGSASSADDAAIALGREFLTAVLSDFAHGPLGAIAVQGSRFIGALGIGFTLKYSAKLDPASFALQLQPGRIRVQVSGTGSLSPGGSFGFRVTQHVGLSASGGKLLLALSGGVQIDITQGNPLLKLVLSLVKGSLEGRVETALAGVVAGANDELNRVLSDSIGGLLARVSLSGVTFAIQSASIDSDAILAGGRFDIGPAPAVVARLVQRSASATTAHQTELDAYESWIPGGTVERYAFRQVSAKSTVLSHVESPHRFVVRGPFPPASTEGGPGLLAQLSPVAGWPPTSWCVSVHGTQLSGAGTRAVSGSLCGMSVLTVGLDLSAGERLTVSVPDGEGGVLADVDPWGGYRAHAFADDTEARGYLLVHHWNAKEPESVKALREALASIAPPPGDETASARVPRVLATLVVPAAKDELPEEARSAPELALTRDAEGAWRRRFRLEAGDTVLVGPGKKELFRARGPLRAEELKKVLTGLHDERSGTKPRPPRGRSLGIALGLGALAPDFHVPCDSGVLVASRKLGGRERTLVFWTSWSEPSLEELRRLGASVACADDKGDRPLVLCVNDGETPERAAAALKEHGLDVMVLADPDRVLARRYGIACWPTVVHIDGEGRIAGSRLGLERTVR